MIPAGTTVSEPEPACDHFWKSDADYPGAGCANPVAYACDCRRCKIIVEERFHACEGHLGSRAILAHHKRTYPNDAMNMIRIGVKTP